MTLLARGAWADEIEQKGLKIRRKYIGKSVQLSIPVIRTLEAEDVYDVIFVVMRCTQLCDVLPILQANASERVVFVGNNLDGYLYEKAMPEKDVYFAFCASAGQRKNGQVVGIDLKRITIGQFHTDEPADSFIHAIFQDTGYKVTYLTNMEDFLLCHAAYVVPVAFAVYRTDGQLKSLVKDPAYMERVLEAIREGYRAIEAAGHEILPPSDRTYDTEAYGS